MKRPNLDIWEWWMWITYVLLHKFSMGKETHSNKRFTFFLKGFSRWRLCGWWVKVLVHKFLSLLLNEFLQTKIMQKSRSVQNITKLLPLPMNNQVQFVCLWCCVPPNYVVQVNMFSSVLFSVVIHKRRRKKLTSKTMQFVFFILKTFKNRFCRKPGNDANKKVLGRGREGLGGQGHVLCVTMTQCVRKSVTEKINSVK